MGTPRAPDRPVPVRFFPASRLGLVVGLAVGLGGAVLVRVGAPSPPPVVDESPPALVPASGVPAREPPPTLDGRVSLPGVVNVWLESCADCMPAFKAWREIERAGALAGVLLTNVAYGQASPQFVEAYRVHQNLIVDADGELMVKRFGIGSFTTLVLDRHGHEVLRDRPERQGYPARVNAAWRSVASR